MQEKGRVTPEFGGYLEMKFYTPKFTVLHIVPTVNAATLALLPTRKSTSPLFTLLLLIIPYIELQI